MAAPCSTRLRARGRSIAGSSVRRGSIRIRGTSTLIRRSPIAIGIGSNSLGGRTAGVGETSHRVGEPPLGVGEWPNGAGGPTFDFSGRRLCRIAEGLAKMSDPFASLHATQNVLGGGNTHEEVDRVDEGG